MPTDRRGGKETGRAPRATGAPALPRPWWLLAAIPLLAVVRIGLFNDDFVGFVEFAGRGWAGVLAQFHPHDFEFLRPLGFAFFRVELDLFGGHAAYFHLAHLALFVVAAALAGRIAGRLAGPGAAAWAPALALLYPARIETVAWLAALFDLLALVLVEAALLLVLSPRWERPAPKLALLAALGFLAPLAKESAYALPLVIAAWELLGILAPASRRIRLARGVATAVGATAAIGFRYAALGGVGGYAGTSLRATLPRLARLPECVGRVLFLPVNPGYGALSVGAAVLAGAALALILAAAARTPHQRSGKAMLAALAVVVAGLLPALPYLQPATMVWSQNRNLAITGLGAALLATVAIASLRRSRAWLGGALLAAWCGAALLNLASWQAAARCRDTILAGIERATRAPGTHTIWVAGQIDEIHGAQLLGGRLAEAVRLALPARQIEVDSESAQHWQDRAIGPPRAAGGALHLFRFDPAMPALFPLDRAP